MQAKQLLYTKLTWAETKMDHCLFKYHIAIIIFFVNLIEYYELYGTCVAIINVVVIIG